jgi:hypothetical protein
MRLVGPRLGTLASGDNVCLEGTRRATLCDEVKYFAWDDAKNAKLRTVLGIGFEDIAFHFERGAPLDILEHPNPTVTPASASSSSAARTTCPDAVPAFARELATRASARSGR